MDTAQHHQSSSQPAGPTSLALFRTFALVLTSALCLGLGAGCGSTAKKASQASIEPEPLILHAGDVVKISFPGNPALDTQQQIRRDGKITLDVVGEVKAADRTPTELEKELLRLFASQLVSKEIKVTVVTSTFSVFVIGAVLSPGKLQLDRAVTAFEAIMEAGGFDMAKANLSAVTVIRSEGGKTTSHKINLKAVIDGKPSEPFMLKPYDTVYVPEKFQWF